MIAGLIVIGAIVGIGVVCYACNSVSDDSPIIHSEGDDGGE